MHNINLRRLFIFLVVMVLITPPLALYLQHKLYPPVHLFELTYTETLDEEAVANGEETLVFTYCFEVPGDLDVNNDLQDFFVQMTRKDLKEIVLSNVTGIDEFSYKTKEGCGDYTAMIKAETVKSAYSLYRNGEL